MEENVTHASFGSVRIRMTLAALAIALVAVAVVAGAAQAQTPGKPFPDPKPCGPGAEAVPSPADATISEGHFAVFDGYWNSTDKTLELNLCPPEVMHSMETRKDPTKPFAPPTQVEVSTRTDSKVDIRETVIHIDGKGFTHELTAADLEEYDFFREGDPNGVAADDPAVGETIWWLKVDDPETEIDEDSPLAMGYSAALFDSDYWYLEDGTPNGAAPLQYEFEVIREPGIPVDELGHVFAFDDEAPPEGEAKTADWDSSEVDTNALKLFPGKYHHYQWAFTRAGTYEISVQLKGHVRQTAPDGVTGWEPISDKKVETSEVRRYVFQIGPLDLNEQPAFEVERSVAENSSVGTVVGDAIPVYRRDDDPLTFSLSGKGHSLFSVEPDTKGNAQIKVAGDLDFETRPEYVLKLGVSDHKDFEGNTNDLVDSVVAVKISVTNVVEKPVLTLTPDITQTVTGTTVTFTATKSGDIPGDDSEVTYHWVERDMSSDTAAGEKIAGATSRTLSVTKRTHGTWSYAIKATWDGLGEEQISSNSVTVRWNLSGN